MEPCRSPRFCLLSTTYSTFVEFIPQLLSFFSWARHSDRGKDGEEAPGNARDRIRSRLQPLSLEQVPPEYFQASVCNGKGQKLKRILKPISFYVRHPMITSCGFFSFFQQRTTFLGNETGYRIWRHFCASTAPQCLRVNIVVLSVIPIFLVHILMY